MYHGIRGAMDGRERRACLAAQECEELRAEMLMLVRAPRAPCFLAPNVPAPLVLARTLRFGACVRACVRACCASGVGHDQAGRFLHTRRRQRSQPWS